MTVNGSQVSELTTWIPTDYVVTFSETGLPSGTSWWENLTNGLSFNATGNTIISTVPNGTYVFTIGTPDKTYFAPGGSFTIYNGSGTESVVFSRVTYSVGFTELGLPSGTSWTVLINGTPLSGTGALAIQLPNGTYSWMITSLPSGNMASPSQGTLAVNGGPVTVAVTVAPSGPPTHLGSTLAPIPFWVWILIAAILIAVVAVVVVLVRGRSRMPPVKP